jgi:lipoate-protein ligase A
MVKCIFLDTPPLDVYGQMAVDELLVPQNPAQDICMARFFNWEGIKPSATFGYAQFEDTAARQIKAAGIQEYTRRPTGGGVVIHKDDLTFSLFFMRASSIRPAEIYSGLHKTIKEEFLKNNLALAAYDKGSEYRPAVGGVSLNCFTNPVSDDLLDNEGNKVLGGAIRRFGGSVLYHGSLQLKGARNNKNYKETLKAAFLRYFDAAQESQTLSPGFIDDALALAKSRYMTKAWIEKF